MSQVALTYLTHLSTDFAFLLKYKETYLAKDGYLRDCLDLRLRLAALSSNLTFELKLKDPYLVKDRYLSVPYIP